MRTALYFPALALLTLLSGLFYALAIVAVALALIAFGIVAAASSGVDLLYRRATP